MVRPAHASLLSCWWYVIYKHMTKNQIMLYIIAPTYKVTTIPSPTEQMYCPICWLIKVKHKRTSRIMQKRITKNLFLSPFWLIQNVFSFGPLSWLPTNWEKCIWGHHDEGNDNRWMYFKTEIWVVRLFAPCRTPPCQILHWKSHPWCHHTRQKRRSLFGEISVCPKGRFILCRLQSRFHHHPFCEWITPNNGVERNYS